MAHADRSLACLIVLVVAWPGVGAGQSGPPVPAATPGQPATAAASLEGRIVRDIRIAGLKRSPEARVREHLASRVGEPFCHERIEADRRQLDALKWFSRIDIVPRADGDAVVIDITVAETLHVLALPALGVTDQDGLTYGVGVRAVNVGPFGTSFGLTAKFGGATIVDAKMERTPVTPGSWPTLLWVVYRDADNPLFDFDERSVEVIARVGRNFTERLHAGVRTGYLRMDTGGSTSALSPDGTDDLVSLGSYVVFDSVDAPTRPRRGWRAEADVGVTKGDAASWSFTLDVRRYQPLASKHQLALIALGTVQSGEVGIDLPEYLQFGLGGLNSVHGWALGARIGQNQAIGTAEYQYEAMGVRPFSVKGVNFYLGILATAFADVGLARGSGSTTPDSAIDGYGLGLRLLVPFVDVIRLDVAWGDPSGGARAYFGVDFKADRQRERVR